MSFRGLEGGKRKQLVVVAGWLTLFLCAGCSQTTHSKLTREQSISLALHRGDVGAFAKHVKSGSEANGTLNGVPYLLSAYQSKSRSIFDYLISIGADVNYRTQGGTLPSRR